jgi:hypothetical protein
MGFGLGGGIGPGCGWFGNSWAFAIFLILILLIFSNGALW